MHFLVKWSEDRAVFNSMQFCFQEYLFYKKYELPCVAGFGDLT